MNFSRTHDAHRRLHLLHGPDLHRRSVRAQEQAIAQRLRFLTGDEKRVLRVARGMVRRKVQSLEIVKVGFNLRPFLNRVAQIAEDANHLVHRLDDGMFGADGTANAGEGDVETATLKFFPLQSLEVRVYSAYGLQSGGGLSGEEFDALLSLRYMPFHFSLDCIYSLPNFTFRIGRRDLEPEICNLGYYPVFPS